MPLSQRVCVAIVIMAAMTHFTFSQSSFAHDDESGHSHPHTTIKTSRSNSLVLAPAAEGEAFQFVIYGDRTGGRPEGLEVLKQAVVDTNLLDPDLVMTVGDLIQGYNEEPEWLEQMREYKEIMGNLRMQWFPVAGNHDVYWRGKGPAPQGQHDANYEKHFGPLWYSFRHKNAGFIVLYSDEGDPSTNEKGFNSGRLQTMSPEQLEFLKGALQELSDLDHTFVFLHHPRWIGAGYTDGNWDVVHQALVDAGNVSAVFAGHIHHMRYDGLKDGIEYFTLATTGGSLGGDIPGAGYLHHFNIVTVRESRVTVSALPVGAVFDPKDFTPEFLDDINLARSIRPVLVSPELLLKMDGSVSGTMEYSFTNPSSCLVELTASFDSTGSEKWSSSLDHEHLKIEPKQSVSIQFEVTRKVSDPNSVLRLPSVTLAPEYVGAKARIKLPSASQQVDVQPEAVPADFFASNAPQCLSVAEAKASARVDARNLQIPDGPLTVETWVKAEKLTGFNAIIAKTQSSEFAIFSDEGVPQFDMHLDGKYESVVGKEKLEVGVWTHIAGVFDGEQMRLYINGKLIAEQAASGVRGINQLPLFIGADPDNRGNPTRPFICKLDEVRLSNSAVYSAEFTPSRRLTSEESTELLLHFDRQLGPFVLSESGNGISAILGPKSSLVPID